MLASKIRNTRTNTRCAVRLSMRFVRESKLTARSATTAPTATPQQIGL